MIENKNILVTGASGFVAYNLIKSFESRIQFSNGNILVEQCLFNLGKLGAADISGAINNDKKFTNFKFESNIFVDNQKKFLSKFGIYNKKSIFPSLFVSGNFDLKNIRNIFYEISDNEKLSSDDVDFIEKEFNEIEEWVKNEVKESVEFAESSPYPEAKELYEDVYMDKNYPYIIEY